MNGLILQLSTLRAVVLLPGGKMVRVRRRRGWRIGMEVDPYAAAPFFGRPAISFVMAVFVLAVGIGGFSMLSSNKDRVVTTPPDTEIKLLSAEKSTSPSTEETLYPSVTLLLAEKVTLGPSVSPSPSPAISDLLLPIQVIEPTPESTDHTNSADDENDGDDDDDDDDDRYEQCDDCGEIGHDDDDCPDQKRTTSLAPKRNTVQDDDD